MFFTLLAFIVVLGVAAYLIYKQQNDDYDAAQAQSGQSVKATATPTATPAN